jgi:hypothetical protein
MPYSITSDQILFFSQDIRYISLTAAAGDYTTKSIRSSLIQVRILQTYFTICHCKTCLKKRNENLRSLLRFYITIRCACCLLCYTHAHITCPHSFIASTSKSYIKFQYSNVSRSSQSVLHRLPHMTCSYSQFTTSQ